MSYNRTIRRSGFTMIELVTVITIIALLTALLAGASVRFVSSARESATITTIAKVNGILEERIQAFRQFDFTDVAYSNANAWNNSHDNALFSGGRNNLYSFLDLASSFNSTVPPRDAMSTQLAEILTRKAQFKRTFPQSFNELTQTQRDRFFGASTVIPPTGTFQSKYESGIVLYAFLTKGETFGAPTLNEDIFVAAEIRNDLQTGNLPCLVDGWGEPLRFYRWPTRLIRCGEQDFNGNGTFDDYNNNGVQDLAGWVDPATGNASFSPAIRPSAVSAAPTPASLLISNLPPFNATGVAIAFSQGVDKQPGFGAYATAPAPYNSPPWNYLGMPDTDDPEPLNIDPDDPSYRLSQWLFDPSISLADQKVRRTNFVKDFHDFYTQTTPLVVSAGPDRNLGLYEPTDNSSATAGYLAAPIFPTPPPVPSGSVLVQDLFDNISNQNRRPGGR